MPRKKKPPLSFTECMKKLANANLSSSGGIRDDASDNISYSTIESLGVRIKKILNITDNAKKSPHTMMFFVMYDIESNKVRTLVHKYLKRNGCTPIQRSVFLANTSVDIYEKIRSDLAEVQAAYDNNDSIIVLPVTTDYLRMMKIIGQKIEVDIITHSRNTLFF